MSLSVEAALPFWLDRPDEEALDIALEVERARLGALWVGEMATFDAIALATAIGHRAPGLPLKLGPLAIGVRTSAEVTRAMFDLAGGSAIYDGASLQRRFRDAHTATAHFQVNEASRELPGRILLGQPADASML